jgi:hypothetical protein
MQNVRPQCRFYGIPITPATFASRKCPQWQITGACAGHKKCLEHSFIASRKMAPADDKREHLMLDVIMIAIVLGFFALSVGYTIACDRL